jgi:hypothetical protein
MRQSTTPTGRADHLRVSCDEADALEAARQTATRLYNLTLAPYGNTCSGADLRLQRGAPRAPSRGVGDSAWLCTLTVRLAGARGNAVIETCHADLAQAATQAFARAQRELLRRTSPFGSRSQRLSTTSR